MMLSKIEETTKVCATKRSRRSQVDLRRQISQTDVTLRFFLWMGLYQRFLHEDRLVTNNLAAKFPTFSGLFPDWKRSGPLINTYWATKAIRASGLIPVALSIRIGEEAIATGISSRYGLLEWYTRRLNFRLGRDQPYRPYWLALESTDPYKEVAPHFHGCD